MEMGDMHLSKKRTRHIFGAPSAAGCLLLSAQPTSPHKPRRVLVLSVGAANVVQRIRMVTAVDCQSRVAVSAVH